MPHLIRILLCACLAIAAAAPAPAQDRGGKSEPAKTAAGDAEVINFIYPGNFEATSD